VRTVSTGSDSRAAIAREDLRRRRQRPFAGHLLLAGLAAALGAQLPAAQPPHQRREERAQPRSVGGGGRVLQAAQHRLLGEVGGAIRVAQQLAGQTAHERFVRQQVFRSVIGAGHRRAKGTRGGRNRFTAVCWSVARRAAPASPF
jgi:hypothetical protein